MNPEKQDGTLWTSVRMDLGCVRGNCSQRPFPKTFYDFDADDGAGVSGDNGVLMAEPNTEEAMSESTKDGEKCPACPSTDRLQRYCIYSTKAARHVAFVDSCVPCTHPWHDENYDSSHEEESMLPISNFMQSTGEGICFAHGPYKNADGSGRCPQWPVSVPFAASKCVTDPQKPEFLRMGIASLTARQEDLLSQIPATIPPKQIGQAFLDAVAYIKAHGYPDWDGTANGQSVTLTACANLMCAVNERVRALQDTNRKLNRRVGELMKALNGTTDRKIWHGYFLVAMRLFGAEEERRIAAETRIKELEQQIVDEHVPER